MAGETVWKLEIQQGNTSTVLKNLDTMLLSAKERFDQVATKATQAANNFKATSTSMADLASKAGNAGQGMSRLDTLQSRAAEAAKKLDIAQAQAALALKKAEDATNGGKASAEQLAVVQARAALAAERVHTAETQLGAAMQKVSIEAEHLSSAEQEATTKTSLFTRAIDTARNALASIASSAGSTTSHITELATTSQAADREMSSSFQHSSKGLLDLASKAGMALFGLQQIVQMAVNAGQSLLGPVMSAEQLGIAFTTLDGSAQAASAEIQKLNRFADVTPFEPEPVQRYAAQLQGMKIAASKVIPIMTSLGDALYGIGHGSDEEMGQVVDIIGKINIQGRLMEGDFTQLGEHGIDALGAIAAGAGKTEDEIRQMTKDGVLSASDAIDDLTRGIEKNPLYKGGMGKQANSLSGIMSTLSGYVKEALDSFLGLKDGMIVSGSIIDRFKGSVASLTAWVQSPAFQNFATVMGERVGVAIQRVADFTSTKAIPAFMRLEGFISTRIAPAVIMAAHWFDTFVGHGQFLIPLLAGIGAILAAIVVPAVVALAISTAEATLPFLLLGAAVAGAVAIFLHFYNSNAGFHAFVDNIGKAIQRVAGIVYDWVNSGQALRDIMAGLQPIIDYFAPKIQELGTAIQNAANFVYQWVGSGQALKDVMGALQPSIDYWEPEVQAIGNAVEDAATAVFHWVDSGKALKDTMSGLQPAIDYLAPKFKDLGDAFARLRDVAMPVIERVADAIGQFSQKAAESGVPIQILHGIFTGIVFVVGLVADGLTLLVNGISNVITWFTTGGSNAQWLWDMLAGIGAFLASTFAPLWQQLVGVWQGQVVPAFAQLMPAINQLIGSFQPLIPIVQLIGAIIGGILVVVLGLLVGVIAGVISALAGLLGGLAQALGGVIQIISGVIQIVVGIVAGFIDLITGHFDRIPADLAIISSGVISIFVGMWQVLSGIFMAAFGFFYGLISGFVAGIVGFFQNLYNILVGHSLIPDMINGIISWFQQLPGRAIAFVVDLATSIRDKFASLVSDAPRWAADMINGFIDKIRSLVGNVGQVASEVGQKIRDFLHFSVPDKGPLADADEWMPDFGDLLTQGLNAQVGKIGGATFRIASTLALPAPDTPSFAASRSLQSSGSAGNDTQATQYLAQIAMLLSQLVGLQQKGNGGSVVNNFNAGPMNVQLLNHAIQSLSGFGYEAVQRGAW